MKSKIVLSAVIFSPIVLIWSVLVFAGKLIFNLNIFAIIPIVFYSLMIWFLWKTISWAVTNKGQLRKLFNMFSNVHHMVMFTEKTNPDRFSEIVYTLQLPPDQFQNRYTD